MAMVRALPRHPLLRLLILFAVIGQCLGVVTVHKRYNAAESAKRSLQVPIHTIDDDVSIWRDSSLNSKYGTIEKAYVEIRDSSSLCYNTRPVPKSKVPWIVLISADTTACKPKKKVHRAHAEGYAGVIFYSGSSLRNAKWDMFEFEEERRGPGVKQVVNFPIFFVGSESGKYLQEVFDDDQPEKLYFVRLEKRFDWISWLSQNWTAITSSLQSLSGKIRRMTAKIKDFLYSEVLPAVIVCGIFSVPFVICFGLCKKRNPAVPPTGPRPRTYNQDNGRQNTTGPRPGEYNYQQQSSGSGPGSGTGAQGQQQQQRQGPRFEDFYAEFRHRSQQKWNSNNSTGTGASSGTGPTSKPQPKVEDSEAEAKAAARALTLAQINFYKNCQTLGISTSSTFECAKAKYRTLCKRHHPDHSHDSSQTEKARNLEMMQRVNPAWEELEIYFKWKRSL